MGVAIQDVTSIPANSPEVIAKSVVVLDPIGEIFDRMRELRLPAALWRVLDPRRISTGLDLGLTVYAAYGPVVWDEVSRLSQRAPAIIVTTAYRRAEAQEAMERELIGYLDAATPQPSLDRAIRGVLLHGESAFPREVIGDWMRARHEGHGGANGGEELTHRQQEVVTLIARGATDKEIAAVLGIAQATAQKHVTNILQRLHVPNRAAAVAVMSSQRRLTT